MDMGAIISDGEWNVNYGGIYSTNEEADFMAQLLGNCSLPSDQLPNAASNLANWPVQESHLNMKMASIDENSMYSSDENATNNGYCLSQSSSFSNPNFLFPSSSSSSHENGYYPNESHHFFMQNTSSIMSMDYSMEAGDEFLNQELSNDSLESNENMNESVLHGTTLTLGMDQDNLVPGPESLTEEKVTSPSDISKKRCRVPSDNVQRNKRSVKPKKNQRASSSDNDEEEKKVVYQRQHSMSCSSEYNNPEYDDELNAPQEVHDEVVHASSSKGRRGAINSSGKARASRGSATDPQSLYARKRRERINERLKVLQNLVPNGTKVDMSTMLEEAVQYVKFLQLQIKLLSSDDLWMYSPIAYNGMDIGLDLKIATSKS